MPNPVLTTLRELVNDALSFGLNGPQIDALVAASAFNFLDGTKPVPALIVNVPTAAAFRPFIRERKTNAVFINYKTRFISIFPSSPGGLPIPRVYVLEIQDLFEFFATWREFETSGI